MEEEKGEIKKEDSGGESASQKLLTNLSIVLSMFGVLCILAPKFIETDLNTANIGLWIITISIMIYLFLKNKES